MTIFLLLGNRIFETHPKLVQLYLVSQRNFLLKIRICVWAFLTNKSPLTLFDLSTLFIKQPQKHNSIVFLTNKHNIAINISYYTKYDRTKRLSDSQLYVIHNYFSTRVSVLFSFPWRFPDSMACWAKTTRDIRNHTKKLLFRLHFNCISQTSNCVLLKLICVDADWIKVDSPIPIHNWNCFLLAEQLAILF